MNRILYNEKQGINKWILNVLLTAVFGYVLWILVQPLMLQQSLNAKDILPKFLTPAFMLLLTVFLKNIQLQTQITNEGIYVRFYPFQLIFKLYRWEDIKKMYIRNSSSLTEYKGWGMKGYGGNRAYSISGDIGLQIIFVNDDRFFIGTQNKEALKQTLLQIVKARFEAEKSL